MITIGIKAYPRAFQAAQLLQKQCSLPFPLNVSLLLQHIEQHNIHDVSSRTYNSSIAQCSDEMLFPQHAWTIYNQHLDFYLIVWNIAQPIASIRYSVAHEIGHILLNHERSWPTDISLKKRQKEAEANVFAHCLLAPFKDIHALCHGRPYNARLMADYFDIPYPVAKKLRYEYEFWLLNNTYMGHAVN